MAYVAIDDFKGGQDTTRDAIVAKPGTLQRASNVHFSRGGDIVKRKAFDATYSLPENTHGMASVGGVLYVFGSVSEPSGMPSGVTYQRLQHRDSSTAMSRVLFVEPFNGVPYVIAEYADGAVFHFYNGSRVTSWDTLAGSNGSNSAVALALATKIDSMTSHKAAAVGAVVTITAAVAGTGFTIAKSTTDGGGTDDQDITLATVQANVEGVTEVLASGTIDVTAGTESEGVNQVLTVTVNGVDVLGEAVDFVTSTVGQTTYAATAAAVAAQITAYESTPNYTATSSGDTVTITAVAGSGATPNGYVISGTVAGDVTIGNAVVMASGVTAVTALKQQVTATISGTFEVQDVFTLTVDGTDYSVSGGASGTGTAVTTSQSKMYSPTQSLLQFCAIDDPTAWASGTGYGVINMANQNGGSQALIGLGVYQNKLAVFAESVTQIWAMDPDPAANAQVQTLPNIGTIAARSVANFGDVDIFFLSKRGVRSLRPRDSSNLASVQDVGTAIDADVIGQIADVTASVSSRAVAVLDPIDGRYLLAIGSKAFVFTFFSETKVSAWSEYELGYTIDDLTVFDDKIHARSGDTIYVYGGDDGATYDAETVTIETGYINGNKDATFKQWKYVDFVLTGLWTVYTNSDPDNPDAWEEIGIFGAQTLTKDKMRYESKSPLVRFRFVNAAAGAATISKIIAHYTETEAA